MSTKPRILVFAGSAREGSLNKKLARIGARCVTEAGGEATFVDLRDYPIPLYDGDLEARDGMPPFALKLRDLFLSHQGLLIASPENNGSVAALLKNTIDWLSREHQGRSGLEPYRGKVAAIGVGETAYYKHSQSPDPEFVLALKAILAACTDAGVDPSQIDEVVLVGGSTRMPKVQQLVREFFKKEPHKGVNPDEVVAIGAAVQGGVLAGEVKDVLLLDVTPLSLGIETLGGVMTRLIERNTTIPTRKSETFSTATDNQTSVEVHVLQGERPLSRDNRTLGRFHLVGLPPAPRGVPQVEVSFDIDANGIVNVTAKDLATGKVQQITISGSSGLAKDEVDRMVKDAQSHADDDRARRDLIDARNRADATAYQVEKIINENRARLPVSELSRTESALADLKKAAAGDDLSRLQGALETLEQASRTLAEHLHHSAHATGTAAGPPTAEGTGSRDAKVAEVVDAEFAETT